MLCATAACCVWCVPGPCRQGATRELIRLGEYFAKEDEAQRRISLGMRENRGVLRRIVLDRQNFIHDFHCRVSAHT